MEEKLNFAPCAVEVVCFDGEKDVIVTSGAHDSKEWYEPENADELTWRS